MPTRHRRHSITETPELSSVLRPLREQLGDRMPTFSELVRSGALAELRALEARERVRDAGLSSFVDRLRMGSSPDLHEFDAIRRTARNP